MYLLLKVTSMDEKYAKNKWISIYWEHSKTFDALKLFRSGNGIAFSKILTNVFVGSYASCTFQYFS